MRYQNWDVLLFPEDSKTPVQEFKTQCFVTRDYESTFLATAPLSVLANPNESRLLTQLPVLTCFVPSSQQNAPFRISIHTWDKLKASRTTESLMQPEDSVVFEARIYIDGLFVCGTIFDLRSNWPQVINTSSQLDKDGNPDALRFPPFHQEILQQSHWDAGEMLGRIRVVIAEGFARLRRSPPFERVKDIVAFSFQHAPLHVLEYSAIAWPNATMWAQVSSRQAYAAPPPGTRCNQDNDEDAHAHSPNRQGHTEGTSKANAASTEVTWKSRAMPPPAISWGGAIQPDLEAMADPFVDLQLQPERSRRSKWSQKLSIEDVPMPDYRSHSDSDSSRAISGMTGVSYEHKPASVVQDIDDAAIAELVEALSPLKGTQAPANTPAGELASCATSRPSAAAEARSASYGNSVRSKKEGSNKENDASAISSRLSSQASQSRVNIVKAGAEGVCDGKRKRSTTGTPEGRKVSEAPSAGLSARKDAPGDMDASTALVG